MAPVPTAATATTMTSESSTTTTTTSATVPSPPSLVGSSKKRRCSLGMTMANPTTHPNPTTTTTTTTSSSSSKKTKTEEHEHERAVLHRELDYTPLSLLDVSAQLTDILKQIPRIPPNGFLLLDSSSSALPNNNNNSNHPNKDDASALTIPKQNDDPNTTTTTVVPPMLSSSGGVTEVVVPSVTSSSSLLGGGGFGYDKTALKQWAIEMQHCIEQVGYVLPNVPVATYQWGTHRSGAADQNVQLLCSELARSQDQIQQKVSPRLNDVVCPVVTILTNKTITTKHENTETKQNYFIHTYEDADYVELCYISLGRNAKHLRHLLIANVDKMLSALHDYVSADSKDKDSVRDFVY
jgi:hypothetical protein